MAITKNERGYKFDFDAVNEHFDELAAVEIGRYTVSRESMDKIEKILDLENQDEEHLRAIRNAVVSVFHDKEMKEANLTEDGEEIPGKKVDYDKMMFWSNKISGITAVIDNVLWTKGYGV